MARVKKFAEIRNKENGEVLARLMVPRAEDDPLSLCLRTLTHQLQLKTSVDGHGGFGGPFGYGVDFENGVFAMHPDWQGDCTCGATEPIHSAECRARFDLWRDARNSYGVVPSTAEDIEAEIADSMTHGLSERAARLMACCRPLSFERMEEYERDHPTPPCICEAQHWVERETHDPTCRLTQHCFTHKPSGFVMDWYKYIGRDNEIRDEGAPITLSAMFEECLASIGAPSLDVAFDAYVKAEAAVSEAARRSLAWMTDD